MPLSTKGYILFATLLFLQLFSLLSLYELSIPSIAIKMNNQVWKRDQYRYDALQILTSIENTIASSHSSCFIPITPSTDLLAASLEWWAQIGCSGNFSGNQYYYAVEFLDEDPCGMINSISNKRDENQLLTAEYYRITLIFLPHEYRRTVLQSTFVKPSDVFSVCTGKHHQVPTGRQMWRELRN